MEGVPDSPRTYSDSEQLDSICQTYGLITFRDSMGELYARIPDDPVQQVWSFKTGKQRVLAWLSEKYFAKYGTVILPAQLTAFFKVLEGRGYQQHEMNFTDEGQLVTHIINQPLLQVVVKFMESKESSWEGLTSVLLTELEAFAEENKISINSMYWPSITRMLTQRLNTYQHVLAQLSIRYEHLHKVDGSHTKLHWIPKSEKTDDLDTEQQHTSSHEAQSSRSSAAFGSTEATDVNDEQTQREIIIETIKKMTNSPTGENHDHN